MASTRLALVATVLLAVAAGSYAQSSIVLKPKIKLVQLSSANSPLTVPIISPGGLASGGTPPLTLAYLTPLPLNTKSAHFNRIKKEMIKSGASPQAILPGIPFAYRFSTNKTAAGDAILTRDNNIMIPDTWWSWYSIIPWPIGYNVRDAKGQNRTGSIFVFVQK